MRPTNSKGASILPALKTSSPKAFLAMARVLLKELIGWNVAGKKTSWLFQETQGGKSSGIGEALGCNLKN